MTATKVFGRTDFVPTKKKGKWYFVSEKRGSLLSSVEYVATDFVVLYVCCYTLHFPSLLFIFVHARFYFWKARAKFDRVCWQKHENTYGTVTLLSCVFVYVRLFDGDTVTKKINKKSTRLTRLELTSSFDSFDLKSVRKKRIVDIIHPSRPGFLFFFFFICSQVLLHRTRLPFFFPLYVALVGCCSLFSFLGISHL